MSLQQEVLIRGLRSGDMLGDRYEILRKLGSGGMGVVVEGRRLLNGKRVAIKLLNASSAPEQASKLHARLIREAKATSALLDEHVVRLYDIDILDDGTFFLVMEMLGGEDLAKHVRSRDPLPIQTAVDMILQACSGVAEAHARGIIHRDLKPHNLFLAERLKGPPIVKVLDFGISKTEDPDDPALTTTGSSMGSPQYMSIEQFRNARTVDRRTDIWALGMILHFLLTGRTAYEADNVASYLFRLSMEPPTPVREHRADVPVEIESLILRCLEKDPNSRFDHLGEFALVLAPLAGPAGREALTRIARYAAITPRIRPLTKDVPVAPKEELEAKKKSPPQTALTAEATLQEEKDFKRCVIFEGTGDKLFGAWLLHLVVPILGLSVMIGILTAVGVAYVSTNISAGFLPVVVVLICAVLMRISVSCVSVIFVNQFEVLYYDALKIDGESCQYRGTARELIKELLVLAVPCGLTCGLYVPWALVRMREFVTSKVLGAGRANRLVFEGNPGSLAGTYLVGSFLTVVTLGLYGPWFMNDCFAFLWGDTKLDGRPLQFRKDPKGILGTYLATGILSLLTLGLYLPWGICKILKWEARQLE